MKTTYPPIGQEHTHQRTYEQDNNVPTNNTPTYLRTGQQRTYQEYNNVPTNRKTTYLPTVQQRTYQQDSN